MCHRIWAQSSLNCGHRRVPLQRRRRFFDGPSLASTPEVNVEPQHRRTEPGLAATAGRRHAMRLVRDEYDEIVLVYELSGMLATDPRVLVIERAANQSITRLSEYPANWRDLKDHDLLSLREPRE